MVPKKVRQHGGTLRNQKGRVRNLDGEIEAKNAKSELLRQYTVCLSEQDNAITEFDGSLWAGLVNFVTVYTTEDKG